MDSLKLSYVSVWLTLLAMSPSGGPGVQQHDRGWVGQHDHNSVLTLYSHTKDQHSCSAGDYEHISSLIRWPTNDDSIKFAVHLPQHFPIPH